jgi:PAS domain S-box-containing protein
MPHTGIIRRGAGLCTRACAGAALGAERGTVASARVEVTMTQRMLRRKGDPRGGTAAFALPAAGAADSERLLQLFVQNVADYAVYLMDDAGRVVRWNNGARRLYGFTAAEAIGREMATFYTPEDVAQGVPAQELARAAAQGRVAFEGWRVRKDGERFWAFGVLTALRDGAGAIHGYAKVVRDLTERKRADDRIQALNEALSERGRQLEEVNEELRSFAHSVSHELRGPVNRMQGFALAVVQDQGERLDASGRQALTRIADNAVRMGTLIENLLAFSRADRKKFARAPVDMAALARAVCDEAAHRLEISAAALPPCVGDAAMLQIVLGNLVRNAAKFTAGRDRARIEIGVQTGGDRECVYFVRDNGIGFDDAQAKRLFQMFERLPSAKQFAGSGVGLTIARRIVNRHGGRLWAEGRSDEGATFYFSLPAAASGAHPVPR